MCMCGNYARIHVYIYVCVYIVIRATIYQQLVYVCVPHAHTHMMMMTKVCVNIHYV